MPESKVKNWWNLHEPNEIDQAINSLGPINFRDHATNPSIVIGKIKHLEQIGFYDATTAATQILRVKKLSDELK